MFLNIEKLGSLSLSSITLASSRKFSPTKTFSTNVI